MKLALLLLLVSTPLWAARVDSGALSLNVCDNPRLKKSDTDKLEVRCPGSEKVVVEIVGCVGPKVTRVGQNYTLNCERWVQYQLVPPK